MLSYDLNLRGNMPLYEYLYRCIRDDIHTGRLTAGSKLPSRRSLADHLGISAITVDNAYAQLLSEGYLQAEARRGYFVTASPLPTAVSIPSSLPIRAEAKPTEPAWLVDFTSNEARPEQFPFVLWSRLLREMLSMRQEDLLRNPPPGGSMELREAIAAHLADFRGVHVSAEQIIIGAGTEYLYGLLAQLLGVHSTFAVEDPGYRKAAQVYTAHGIHCCPVAMDAEGIRADLLADSGADAVHVTPSHHYPTGTVMSVGRRWQLLAWAQGGHWIIEDDYDSEFRLSGLPIPALQSMDTSGRVIYLNTFTRTLASTIRISYMVLPPKLLQRYHDMLGFYACTVSSMEQAALAALISRGHFEKHLNRIRSRSRRMRDRLLRGLREHIPDGLAEVSGEDAGLHFLLTLHTRLDDAAVCRLAEAQGIRMLPISSFYRTDPKPAHRFVISYAAIP